MAIDSEGIKQFRKSLRMLERKLADQLDGDTTVCCGVTIAQCRALLAIEERGQTSGTQLAIELELDKSTLSRTIDGLVAGGLVNRETDSDNRRSQHISLTPRGAEVAAGIHDQWDRYFMSIFARIPEEKHALVIEGLSLLAEAIHPLPACCASEISPDAIHKKKRKNT